MFRPREAVVQRLLKKEDDGVYVVLFSSVDTYDARNAFAHEGTCCAVLTVYGCTLARLG
jgi:hypothetical protein